MIRLTLEEAYRQAVKAFSDAGLPDPLEDARHLVTGLCGLSLTALIAEPERVLSSREAAALETAVMRRKRREPVYRILGAREFYGLDFRLSAETLEPRADTEILVERCLFYLKKTVARKGRARLIDLGTGTGAIAITLVKNCPDVEAVMTDISAGALETACENALINGVKNRISAIEGSWFEAVEGRFDMIVSNPPYIDSNQVDQLDPDVRDFDPRAALDGGPDGLDAYRSIARDCETFLAEDGVIALEIGFDQKQTVTAIFRDAGYARLEAVSDLGGNDRVLVFARGR